MPLTYWNQRILYWTISGTYKSGVVLTWVHVSRVLSITEWHDGKIKWIYNMTPETAQVGLDHALSRIIEGRDKHGHRISNFLDPEGLRSGLEDFIADIRKHGAPPLQPPITKLTGDLVFYYEDPPRNPGQTILGMFIVADWMDLDAGLYRENLSVASVYWDPEHEVWRTLDGNNWPLPDCLLICWAKDSSALI